MTDLTVRDDGTKDSNEAWVGDDGTRHGDGVAKMAPARSVHCSIHDDLPNAARLANRDAFQKRRATVFLSHSAYALTASVFSIASRCSTSLIPSLSG